jgi:RecA/RadA recombinase
MAKKTSDTPSGNSIFDLVSAVDNSVEILSQSATAVIDDYINTGSYILNAALTGSLFKGVPSGRVLCLAGLPGSGKSFLAISICREAQKKGYTPIYMDSEGAIDKDFVERLGCDSSKMLIKQVTTISEVSSFMANLLKKINEQPKASRPRVIFVLDSLGNLTSTKELNDVIDATGKRDMTKAQDVKALFRTNATALAKAQAPFIVTSHIYMTQDLFAKAVVSGGSGIAFNASITLLLSTAKLDDKESDKAAERHVGDFTKTGVLVTAKPEKSRFTIPQKVKFQIPFFKAPNPYVGLESYLTWENSGIIRGKMLTQKEYLKLSSSEQEKCFEMTDVNGEITYAYPKDTSKNIVVKHLRGEVPLPELFSSKVLTEELLHKLDDEVIRPNFELPSQSTSNDIDEFIENEMTQINTDAEDE